jgi:HPr kinase/phosphorylase
MLLKDLINLEGLELLTEVDPADLNSRILSPNLHGLESLRGAREQFPPQGLVFLLSLEETQAICHSDQFLDGLFKHRPSALVVDKTAAAEAGLRERCTKPGLLLLGTDASPKLMKEKLGKALFSRVKECVSLHGVLVLVWGRGLLVLGASGSGKTDMALELVWRGHQFITDDAVELFCPEPGVVYGRPLSTGAQQMAVYGVGLLEVARVCGPSAVVEQGPIDQVIELVDPDKLGYENPLEAEGRCFFLMGIPVPYLTLSKERSPYLTTLMEVAIRRSLSQEEMNQSNDQGGTP